MKPKNGKPGDLRQQQLNVLARGTEKDTYESDVRVNGLDSSVRTGDEQLGVDQLLDGKDDTVLCSDTESGSTRIRREATGSFVSCSDQAHNQLWMESTYPPASTALPAYST
jgi:hypothetical protein